MGRRRGRGRDSAAGRLGAVFGKQGANEHVTSLCMRALNMLIPFVHVSAMSHASGKQSKQIGCCYFEQQPSVVGG
jgi:hypothetical protein